MCPHYPHYLRLKVWIYHFSTVISMEMIRGVLDRAMLLVKRGEKMPRQEKFSRVSVGGVNLPCFFSSFLSFRAHPLKEE